jgi:ATP-dependent DNA ligase
VAHSEAEVKALFRRVRDKGGQTYSCVNTKKISYKDSTKTKVVIQPGTTITYTVPRGEGVMVKNPDKPYEFTRSDACLKVKEFYTADLRITGAYEGKPGTKYVGMLGGLELASDCGKYSTDCGSLQGDEGQRFELWMMHQRGELVGKIYEVSFQEITADGSLRFPVGIRLRDDKNTTNVEV